MPSIMTPREQKEPIHVLPWKSSSSPEKVLAIRLQAFGDTVITFPYLQSLRSLWPSSELHFLTREEFGDLPFHLKMFETVHTIGGGRNRLLQVANAMSLIPRLRREKYDVVLDLQRNDLSRMVRRLLRPKSFSEFDRFSLKTAGERTRETINGLLGRRIPETLPRLSLKESVGANILPDIGREKIIVLNPAGSFTTRNWPLERYVEFANKWIEDVDANARFALLGTGQIQDKAEYLKKNLGDKILNLVGKTTPFAALSFLQNAELVISEDSGLMHMAWVAQVPVVALFGSTRSAWSKPLGQWSICLNSSDLECGECLEATCRFGDVHCLTRYSAELVVETAKTLLENKRRGEE
jgi:heptosyltransferase-2